MSKIQSIEIADEVTIMRDGKRIGTWLSAELTTDMIISKMVGRDLTHRFPERSNVPGEVVLKVENLTFPYPKSFKKVDFEIREGEILGIGGLVGAQRTELLETLRVIAEGRFLINGKKVKIKSPMDAKKHKIAILTEESRVTGIFPVLSVLENIARKEDAISSIEKLIRREPAKSIVGPVAAY